MGEREAVFFEMFRRMGVPPQALDLGHLSKALASPKVDQQGTHIGLKLDAGREKGPALEASLVGLLSGLNVTESFIRDLKAEPYLRRSGRASLLDRQRLGRVPPSDLSREADRLMWRSMTAWPLAYSSWIAQQANVLYLFKALFEAERDEKGKALEAKGFARENLSIFAEYPRNLPTDFHYAVASLGAWIGGAINVQFFLYHATAPQISDATKNHEAFGLMGMQAIAEALDDGGVLGVPQEAYERLMTAQGDATVFGSLPVDEFNHANRPLKEAPRLAGEYAESKNFDGILVDRYYRTTFRASSLDGRGAYGARDVMRDHFSEFYDTLKPAGLVRCKNYCVPIVEVSHTNELLEIIQRIPSRGPGQTVFRGQRKLHLIKRSKEIREFLFAKSASIEPSLVTSATRDRSYRYEDVHFALRHFLESKIYGDRRTVGTLADKWRAKCTSPMCEVDYAIMALSQHYGIPSHGLDVTSSAEVAIWFATNVFVGGDEVNLSRYDPLAVSDWPDQPDDQPVVIACQAVTNTVAPSLINCHELNEFGFAALRPNAQHASFFHGGHSEHQNRLAETAVCIFRLKPSKYETPVSFTELFPSPDLDPAYRVMLEFASGAGSRCAKHVNKFH